VKLYEYGNFTNYTQSGFTVSGDKYNTVMSLANGQESVTKFVFAYVVNTISTDHWLYNQNSGNGVLGFGPQSVFWNGLVDPVTKLASYTIDFGSVAPLF
jgi:hypothetical protein